LFRAIVPGQKEALMFPWLSFLPYIFIVAYTPGPNNIMSMNNAKNVGFKKGIVFNFGIFAGFFVVMLLCLVFSTYLYQSTRNRIGTNPAAFLRYLP
jgi:threonine/homoserine/homoserine lactone efflux protein